MHERLSIAIVAPLVAPLSAAHPYGNQHFLCDLARALQGFGHRVVIYAASGSRVDGVAVESIDVPSAVQGRFLLLRDNDAKEAAAMGEAFERLLARLRANRPDAISQHAFDREAIVAFAGAPALHTLHLPPSSAPVVDAVRTVESSFCSVSESCAAQWRAATGRPVVAVPNGVPTFHAPVGAVDDVALIAGRISREKGVAAAVRVARRAGLEPRVVGAVYDRDYYEREVAPELAPAKVQPARSRAALVRAMARSAVLLMPIEWDEPFGLVAAEAQRAGCPVVAYRRGALPELVRDGVDGVLVDPGDEEALVEGIARARRLDRLAIRSRAAARFDMAECARRYETALRALAGR